MIVAIMRSGKNKREIYNNFKNLNDKDIETQCIMDEKGKGINSNSKLVNWYLFGQR